MYLKSPRTVLRAQAGGTPAKRIYSNAFPGEIESR
jgi:hypothetical protein